MVTSSKWTVLENLSLPSCLARRPRYLGTYIDTCKGFNALRGAKDENLSFMNQNTENLTTAIHSWNDKYEEIDLSLVCEYR